MASPSSSSSHPPPPPPPLRRPRFRFFTTIPDRQQEEEDDGKDTHQQQQQEERQAATAITSGHHPTPLHPATPPATGGAAPKRTRPASGDVKLVVSYNKCRPSTREKISVVPLDVARGGRGRPRSSSSDASPGNNGVLKSFFSSLTWSPRPSCSSPSAAQPHAAAGEEEWRLAATELSRRLIHAMRKRDETLAEASRLKYSVAELERKLARLESHCRDLKSNLLDHGNHHDHHRAVVAGPVGSGEFPLEPFLRSVSESRSAIRHLSRSLAAQMSRDTGDPAKAQGRRLLQLIQQEDRRPLSSGGGSDLRLFHLEALLSRAFYEDFELAGFRRPGSDRVLEPRARAEANMAAYAALRGLSWDDVLSRGTRHYSEGFSRFCDQKMGELSASAALGGGWREAWPEPLLRAFFEAAKGVWLVHLLAWCAHPPVPVFRVEKGAPFDAGYMEEVAAAAPVPAAVREMLAPGFYVLGGVVIKCRVLCMHSGSKGDKTGSAKVRVHHGHGDRRSNGVRT